MPETVVGRTAEYIAESAGQAFSRNQRGRRCHTG
jgi:hypothetical protein